MWSKPCSRKPSRSTPNSASLARASSGRRSTAALGAFDNALPVHAAPAAPGSVAPPALAGKPGPSAGGRIAIAAAIAGAMFVILALGAAALFASRTTKTPDLPASAVRDQPAPPPAAPNASVATPAGCPAGTVRFAAAEYFMGSDHQHSPANERPAHQVTLSPFCLDQREVTVARYKACADAGRCREAPVGVVWQGITKKERILFGATCNAQYKDRAEHPINCVDWNLAKSFCEAGAGRLPSEAEWEFAARGPNVTRYPWGDAAPDATLLNACDMACKRWGQRNDIPVRALTRGARRLADDRSGRQLRR